MQIRPLCGYYTRVNTPLEGEKYAVLLSLPYQINNLIYQVTKGNVTNIVKTNWR